MQTFKHLLLLVLMLSLPLQAQILNLEAAAAETSAYGDLVNISVTAQEGALSHLLYSSGEEGPWEELRVLSPEDFTEGLAEIGLKIDNYTPTRFKVEALSPDGVLLASTETREAVTTVEHWFNAKRTNMLLAILLISGLIIYYIERAKAAKEIYLRPIAGLKAFEEAVGRATEMGKSVLFVPGIQDLDQVETIAGVIILGHVSKMTARYETSLNVPVSRSLVMEASREIVHESYLAEGRPDLFNPDMVHYLTDDQFAFAAGVNGIMLREKPAALFFQGKFFAESLILAETGNSIGAIQIAGTASPAQIPFFVTACDYTLIGEEFFAASAYLGKDPKLVGSIKGQDIAKAVIMISIGLGVILQSFGFTAFRELFRVM